MPVEPAVHRFTSRRSTVYAPEGVIATSQPLAAAAGLRILRAGGNAFDAAVATAAALNVVEPTNTGLGGDVFGLFRTADGDVSALRSCGGAPDDATIDAVRQRLAETKGIALEEAELPLRGPLTVTVPGTARGWERTLTEFGTRTLADVLGPAISYAKDGYPVSEVVATEWQQADRLFTHPNARAAYLPAGSPPRCGETVRLPRLGESMQLIADEGANVLYEGTIGEQIVDEVQKRGGFLTAADLSAFEPELVEPESTTYRDVEVYELPPNNQGLMALEALNIAEELQAGKYPRDSADSVHYFAEAMKLAFHDGHHYITDPEYENVPALDSKQYAKERASLVGEEALSDISFGEIDTPAENTGEQGSSNPCSSSIHKDADTVLLTVADAEGNVVSYINSRFKGFGSGLVAGDTGIALQNRGASFSLDPKHPNRLEPGKRPFHTLLPAVARFDVDDWAAFGVMGGYMQPQGHLQVLSKVVDYGTSVQEALDAPRWRYREDGRLAVEARMDDGVLTDLSRRGHEVVVEPPSEFGGGQIVRNENGTLSAATEPRKDGVALGF